MFNVTGNPHVFGVAPGVDFPRALIEGLHARMTDAKPEDFARVEIIVNTQRMARRMRQLFDQGPPMLLPRVRLLTSLGQSLKTPLPPAVSPLRRRFELTQIIARLLDQQPDLAPRASLFDLADSLATLMDEMNGEGVSPDAIAALDVSDQSGHWERAQQFFGIARHFLATVAEEPDAETRQRQIVEAIVAEWEENPPQHPVILAGSTGSRGTTMLLMQAIAKLPQGALVLPGFDFDTPASVWATLGDALSAEDHPQFRFNKILRGLDMAPADVAPWTQATPPSPARNRLVSLALRPAPVTDQWLSEGPSLTDLEEACAGVTLLEAASMRDEALAIAMRLRQAAEDGITAALITPDRMLTRQVTAALDRWNILPDDSAGTPLQLSPPGRFLRHVSALFQQELTAEALLTLLKHPLTHSGAERNTHLRLTRDLELHIRRKGITYPTRETLAAFGAALGDNEAWFDWLTENFCDRVLSGTHSLEDRVAAHLDLAEHIARGSASDEGSGGLWDEKAGREAVRIVGQLRENAPYAGEMSAADYADLFAAVLSRGEVRDRDAPHPKILIWGTLEARVQGADLLILGGLNEGSWPESPSPDPWLNRKMRHDAGLLLPERRIGLSAHDFQQAVGAKEVWLTRSIRSDEAETVPSRWINRLANLLTGLRDQGGPEALAGMRARGEQWLTRVAQMEAVETTAPAHRPAPRPPIHARPTRLSVTEIKRLIRDPYAIYAKHVLRLRALDPLMKLPDALLRGIVVHEVLEQFVKDVDADPKLLTHEHLMQLSETILAENVPWKAARALWLSRMNRVSSHFISGETARRKKAKPIGFETRARSEIPHLGFTLSGTADRIDRDENGNLLVYDYKTGTPPSTEEQKFFDKQLLLEAAMAERGGFEDITPSEVVSAIYLGLGNAPKDVAAPLVDTPPAQVWAEFEQLIAKYQDPEQGFTARRALRKDTDIGDYDQLARFGEWEVTDAPRAGGFDVKMNDATRRQVQAAQPQASTWLNANAGSGKTRVLTDRVARLLLQGVEPQHILCLTYTKAAASEMQNRLFKRLGTWAMKEDADLRQELQELGVDGPVDRARLRDARTLFARAIETPGGLKIQTIHSFCASLLRRFPLEAGVSPLFREMEDRSAALLRESIIEDMAGGEDCSLVADFARYFTGTDFDQISADIAKHSASFARTPQWNDICETLAIDPELSENVIASEVFLGDERAMFADLIAAMKTGSVTDQKNAGKLSLVSAFDISDLPDLEKIFLTGATAKSPFSAKIGSIPTKKVQADYPDLVEKLNKLMARVETARSRRLSLANARRSLALWRFGHAFVQRYENQKQILGWLDFDDLILRARDLLNDPTVAAWVLYRLDGGIDHILVDEAQDTSPEQWQVIERLAQEFTSGEGAHNAEHPRTIFVVGDKKQSIYSFQGADPAEFDRMREEFAARLDGSQTPLQPLELEYSFRSSDAILRVVDECFNLRADTDFERHIAFNSDLPGRVDLWPVIEPTPKAEEGDWFDPVDRLSEMHHTVHLARMIAEQIKRMIATGATIPDKKGEDGIYRQRKVRAGDFLILVQRRSDLFQEIIRACKAADLPIAGADRLKVGAELAVRDLAALLSFLSTPEDSLSLATVLRSPLFGWSEQALFDLAHRRTTPLLWQALRDRGEEFPETMAVLGDLMGQTDFLRPFDLIERILTRHNGRAKLLSRLGSEAEDGINALLSQALAYERSSVPSLTGFLVWMETDDLEIKRQMDSAEDRIRVMTVHGSKGLEAPIVIMPDTGKRMKPSAPAILTAGGVPLWTGPSAEMPEAVASKRNALADRQMEERQRLLYVAMTRAEKWLIVAAAGDLDKSGETWYQTIEAGMKSLGAVPKDFLIGQGLHYSHGDWSGELQPEPEQKETLSGELEPIFLHSAPETEPEDKTISPSDLGGAKALPGEAGLDEEAAKARGLAIHALLEHLPNHAPEDWARAADHILDLEEDTSGDATLLQEAARVLNSEHLAPVFAEEALVEVSITAQLGDRRLHGTIDRLIVESDRVLAVDFKTNAVVPKTLDTIPEGLLRQMGAYAHALAQIHPDKTIETALLWTRTAELTQLPQELVKDAFRRAHAS